MKTLPLESNLGRAAIILGMAMSLVSIGPAIADDSSVDGTDSGQLPKSLKSSSGTISHVNATEKLVTTESFWATKTYSLADNCTVALEDKPEATVADLRPGQKVRVRYLNTHGVLIAHGIHQENQVYRGRVETVDPATKSVGIKRGAAVRKFSLPENYKVLLKDNKSGTLADLKVGQMVNVVYESLDDEYFARRIEQKNPTFVGTIRSMDASTRTVKAKSVFEEKTFRLSDKCRIVTADDSDASLRDLRIGDRVEFVYEDKDGVLVANRVGQESPSAAADSSETVKANTKTP
jgi:Cu/Ag efflux protein CusF